MLDRAAYFQRWAQLHGGYDPEAHRLSRWWLSAVYAVARRCHRVAPAVVTGLGVLVGLAVPLLAAAGWPAAAGVAVLASGFTDSLDGAVAIGSGRETRWGFVLDSTADRVTDTAYVLALWVVGAPGWLCALAAGLCALLEYVRARAAAAGMSEIGVVTVFERPTRIVLAALLLIGCGLPAVDDATVVTAGAAAWTALSAIGLAQLAPAVWRALR